MSCGNSRYDNQRLHLRLYHGVHADYGLSGAARKNKDAAAAGGGAARPVGRSSSLLIGPRHKWFAAKSYFAEAQLQPITFGIAGEILHRKTDLDKHLLDS